ncbi:MAG: hypothetical protein QGF46_06070, partial [Planctomycetota bacterium]|nr:hypothetical protein [Planctomycetota bacterium]
MTPKKIIILLLLMLGCGWTVVMLSKQNETTDSGEPVFEQLYPQLNDIVSIKLRRPNYGNGVTLEQRQGVWVVSDPIVDDINTYALRLLSQEFAKIVDREIPGNLASQSHADLGLSNPGFIVETVEADGGIRSLLIGSKPFSANFHVAALDGSLCLVSSSFVSVISRSLESWRSSDLIPMLNPSKIAWQANQSNYSFEINKIITAILVTILVVFGIGKISDIIFDKDDKNIVAYKVEAPEGT